jgi:hypothetical protein
MTLKESVLKSLEDINDTTNYLAVYNNIVEKGYYDFGEAKTPSSTISAILGSFIRTGDSRVKRIRQDGSTYVYYLNKNESKISLEKLTGTLPLGVSDVLQKGNKTGTYSERALHKLLSTYLKDTEVYSKTIFHEQSTFDKDSNQIWTHPDIVGLKLLNLQTKASQKLLKSIKNVDSVRLSSYEIKKYIATDSELKKAYFQAVSNSSWAHYGYLVAFEISDGLLDEISRLNDSFGIGVIKLEANPYKSKTLFPAKYRDLDFKTIDKLCKINRDFEAFIETVEKLITAEDRYFKATEKELCEFSDGYFSGDSEILEYCIKNNIPYEVDSVVPTSEF